MFQPTTDNPIKWGEAKNERINITYRDENGLIQRTSLTLSNIYKFGIFYKPKRAKFKGVGAKIARENGIVNATGYAYIKVMNRKEYHDIGWNTYVNLKKLIRLYGRYRLIKEIPVDIHLYDGRVITRINKEYVCKFNRTQKFKFVNSRIQDKNKKNKVGKRMKYGKKDKNRRRGK